MRCRRRIVVLATAVAAAMMVAAGASAAEREIVALGTAAGMGNYHPVGTSICRIVNATRKTHRLRCVVRPSEGAVANINGVLRGEFDLGLAQGDMLDDARDGVGAFAGRPQPKLRVLFSAHQEVLTLVARQDAGIRRFEDIKGRRVAIGTAGSGTRATMEAALHAFGIAESALQSAPAMRFLDAVPALCDGKIDAFVLVDGHPSSLVNDAAISCATRVAAVDGPPVDALLVSRPYYAKAEIPGGMYRGTDAAQPSLGVRAAVVVSADMPEATAYAITRAVFEHFDDFRKPNPVLVNFTRQDALQEAAVPFHPGALRYFREAGLM